MKLSKERKIFVGLLTLALGAVFIDRIVIGSGVTGPQQVEAGTVPAESASGDRPTVVSFDEALSAPPSSRGPSIGERFLKAVQAQGPAQADMRDAFAPSKAWANELGLVQGETDQQPFEDRHRLVAVIVVNGERYVIIDDQTLGLGHTLDGYTLVDVNERTAVLESNGHRVELKIPSEL